VESTQKSLEQLVKEALVRYNALSPEQKAEHDRLQQESFVRSIVNWPKPNFHWENGVKVYHSYEDYCND
jgi:hypothetical protein